MVDNAEKFIEIRSSGLPTAMDCWRKWAMQMAVDPKSGFAPVMQKHGYTIPVRKKNGIGSSIGTACHEAFGQFFQAKIDGYESAAPENVGLSKFHKLAAEGIEYDKKITKDVKTAVAQVKRMIKEYAPHARTLKPKRAEFKLETRLDPLKPYLLTGHPDIYEVDGAIRDMKFGSHLSPYEPQLGAYRLMARSHGMESSKLFIDWVPRTTLKQEQKPLQVIEYNPRIAETSAHHLINEAVERVEKFTETGDPWAFMANPNSNLCSKTWCPAWGTEFCDLGRIRKDNDDE